jgi:alginate O-acetyltransferase complex protein AlgI
VADEFVGLAVGGSDQEGVGVIFTTLAFLLFISLLVPLYWGLRSDRRRLPLLFTANFFFYGWWDWRFTGLLLLVVILSWGGGLYIAHVVWRGGNAKKGLLVSCALLLGVLGYFKYADFFIQNFRHALGTLGVDAGFTTLNIILPAGVSFYIFQAISYLVSVYNGKVDVERSFLKLGVYLGFFPHLVAGPIIRAHLFLPQLASVRIFHAALFWEGCRKFAIGFLYKAVFADNLAAAINPIWGSVAGRSGSELFGATLGFYGQIYFDFAGYSLMAIGVANWLGYTIPENFRFPYLATSMVDFWRRWHMSLSTWLRDYVYIPLGGNRGCEGRRYFNLVVTMLLGGLWHGASWNFIIWGAVHGAALSVNHLWISLKAGMPDFAFMHNRGVRMAGVVLAWIAVQSFVMLCWVPFRAESFSDTLVALCGVRDFLCGAGGMVAGFPWMLAFVPLLVDTFLVSKREEATRFVISNPMLAAAILTVTLLVGILFMRSELVPFLYFQF